MNRITVCEDWENSKLQTVTDDDEKVSNTSVEDEHGQTDKDSKMESEIANLAENR